MHRLRACLTCSERWSQDERSDDDRQHCGTVNVVDGHALGFYRRNGQPQGGSSSDVDTDLGNNTAVTSDVRGELLAAILDSWDRSNTILINLLRLVPAELMDLRGTATSHTLGELFTHMHYCRLVFVFEDTREIVPVEPKGEWAVERDRERLVQKLNESGAAVRDAVRSRLFSERAMDRHYDHPILMLQHFIWHEGYHHGQIKLILKQNDQPIDDEVAGDVTWDVWMDKAADRKRLSAARRTPKPQSDSGVSKRQ